MTHMKRTTNNDIIEVAKKKFRLQGTWTDGEYFDQVGSFEYATIHYFEARLNNWLTSKQVNDLYHDLSKHLHDIELNGKNLYEQYQEVDTCEDEDGNEKEYDWGGIDVDDIDFDSDSKMLKIRFISGKYY